MTKFHFVAASERFLTEEEPLDEVLRERRRNYAENNKEIDFWLVRQPAFLAPNSTNSTAASCSQRRRGVDRCHLHHLLEASSGVRGDWAI